jgi:pimeloyl-ACP methyl ester carboxylesterase
MKSLRLAVAQVDLRFHDMPGRGVPLLFIHGLGCASSCDYATVAGDPALSGRRMLLVDLLGSGFSDRPADFAYTIDAQARTIAALIDHLGCESLDLFGHSMGGSIAIVVAHLLGEQVRRLVVGEPNLDPGGGFASRRIAAMSEADYVARGHDELVRASRADGNATWAASLALSAPWAVHRGATSLMAGGSPTWRDMLYARHGPKTLLIGSQSLPDPDAERLPLGGVSVGIVPEAGHAMAWQNPSGLAAAIARALA